MKKYLNRQECSDWICLCAMYDFISRMAEDWGDNLDKPERKDLKTASTLIRKSVAHIVERLGVETAIKLKRSADTYQMMMVPRQKSAQFRRDVEQQMKTEGVWCSEELLCLLAEKSLLQCCSPCKEPEEERKECPLRHAFVGLDIPVFDENPGDGICPYCITE